MEIDDVPTAGEAGPLACLLGNSANPCRAPSRSSPHSRRSRRSPARACGSTPHRRDEALLQAAAEMRAMLEIALQAGYLDADQDVHDRAAASSGCSPETRTPRRGSWGEKAPVQLLGRRREREVRAADLRRVQRSAVRAAFVFCDERRGRGVVPERPARGPGAAGDSAGAGDMPGDSLIDFGSDDALSGGAAGTLARSLGEDANPLGAYGRAAGSTTLSFTNEISARRARRARRRRKRVGERGCARADAAGAGARAVDGPRTFQEKWGVLGVTGRRSIHEVRCLSESGRACVADRRAAVGRAPRRAARHRRERRRTPPSNSPRTPPTPAVRLSAGAVVDTAAQRRASS